MSGPVEVADIKDGKSAKELPKTSLILDLNILSKMNEVVKGERTFEDSGLSWLVKFLNSKPGLCPTPGYAIQEVDSDSLNEITASFESFLSTYCKGYFDHPTAIKNYSELINKPKRFQELPLSERYLNSIAYLGILKIQEIWRNDSELEPIDKFVKYTVFMSEKADIVGAIESEAAKYVFFDSSTVKDVKFGLFCKKIKENFKKGGDTHEKLLQRCLNSARDIMYYRLCAHMSGELIDGKKQDTWLVTGDEGLYNLSESIHFVPGIDKSDSKYVTFERHREQKKSDYWKCSDEILVSTIDVRQLHRIVSDQDQFTEESYERLLKCVSDLENELSSLYND